MGLFGKKKDVAPVAPRIAIEDRVPSTPKPEQLANYLYSSGGGYVALGGKQLAGSPMGKEDRDAWHAVRTSADAAFKKLRIGDRETRECLGYLVRDAKDPWSIWLEVDGVRVDRLMRSAVEAWEGGISEPYPVRCLLGGAKWPCVTIRRNKS